MLKITDKPGRFGKFQLAVLILQVTSVVHAQFGPCKNNAYIGDPRRSSEHQMPLDKPYLCDIYLDEGVWYQMYSYCGDRIFGGTRTQCLPVDRCGTYTPLITISEHPTAYNVETPMTVCAPDTTGCCGNWETQITAVLCKADANNEYDFFVYKLKNVPGCDMAYCVGEGQPCPTGSVWNDVTKLCVAGNPHQTGPPTPELKTETRTDSGTYESFYFLCHIQYPTQTKDDGSRFEVALLFNGARSTYVQTVDSLHLDARFEPTHFKGYIGSAVLCTVRSYWKNPRPVKTDWLVSTAAPIFVGITYTSPHLNKATNRVEFNEKQDSVDVTFTSSVPISCGARCKMTFSIYYPGLNQVSSCAVVFTAVSNSDVLSLRSTSTAGTGSMTSIVQFLPVPKRQNQLEKFWEGFQLQDVITFVKDDISVRACTSTGDPHFTSFDRGVIHLYLPGDFTMFQSHSSRFFQVHVRTQQCSRPEIYCNCAVAVREGNNVLGLFACGTNQVPTPIFYMRDSSIPGTTITASNNYHTYTITMPSGAHVIANIFTSKQTDGRAIYYLDLTLVPTSADIANGGAFGFGYCGNYNNVLDDDTFGDRDPRYLVAPQQSLINGHIFKLPCVNFSLPVPQICNCLNEGNLDAAQVDCNTDTNIEYYTTFSYDNCYNNAPSKSFDPDDPFAGLFQNDNVLGADDLPELETPPVDYNITFSWPTPSGTTEEEAKTRCREPMLQSTIYSACKDFVDIEKIADDCATDIQCTDTFDSVNGVMRQLETLCVFYVEAAEVNEWNITSANETVEPPPNPILENITSLICPNECSHKGKCLSGICTCYDGYLGEDCSINSNAPPVMTTFRKGPLCNSRAQSCAVTSIFASNFYNSSDVKCRLTGTGESTGEVHYTAVLFISFAELQCSLPTSPVKRALMKKSTHPVAHWDIAVSSDGAEYSNALAYTVYDGKCQTCTGTGECQLTAKTCLIGELCYAANEYNEADACLKCIPVKSTSDWTYDESAPCIPTTTTPPECTTGETCINNCNGKEDGMYQICQTCASYVKCYVGVPYLTRCDAGNVWDDFAKRCQATSDTCVECA